MEPKSIKNLLKIDPEVDTEKVLTNHEKSMQQLWKNESKIHENSFNFGTCDFLFFAKSRCLK